LWNAFLDPELEQDQFLTSMNSQFVQGCFSKSTMRFMDLEQLKPDIILYLSHERILFV
jgi:hypothetical protein